MANAQDFEQAIGNRSRAASDYFEKAHDRVYELANELNSDSKSSKTFGREFMLLTLSEKKAEEGIAFRRLDVKTQYVSAYIAANAGEPGEFRACIGYDASGRAPKKLTWYFPKDGVPTPQELAEKFVSAILLPSDEPIA